MRRTLALFAFGLLFFALTSCETNPQREERLAKQYCGGCHLFPQPSLLDKATWAQKVLPQMAFRMGFSNYEIMGNISPNDLPIVMETIPSKPMVSQEEWEAITNYFIENSPDSLVIEDKNLTNTLEQFEVFPSGSFKTPFVTLIKFDTLNRKLYVGTRASHLYELDEKLAVIDSEIIRSKASFILKMQEKISSFLKQQKWRLPAGGSSWKQPTMIATETRTLSWVQQISEGLDSMVDRNGLRVRVHF